MKILFFAFEFPPLSTGGVQRSAKFAKYLHECGIEPVVVTPDEEGYRQSFADAAYDGALLSDLPDSLVIERVPFRRARPVGTGRFAQWRRIYFSIVEDLAESWWRDVEAVLPELLQKYKPAAILVTAPPFSMAPFGCRVAKATGLPLILDLRDAWSQWRVSPYGSWLHYLLTVRLERECLEAADRVVCTSQQTLDDLRRLHRSFHQQKGAVITNGFDLPVDNWTFDECQRDDEKFVIGYVGGFYYDPASRDAMMSPWWRKRPNRMIQYAPRKEDWLYRSPWFFFAAVARLFENNPEARQSLKIRFAGHKPGWIDAQVERFGLEDVVEFVGRLDHPGVLRFQSECDALLATSSKVLGGRDYSIAGKTFEYFALRKPVVGFVAEGAQKDILEASGMAVLCDPDDPRESSVRLWDLIQGKTRLRPNASFLNTLHRRELSRRLAELIKEAVNSKQP